MITVVNKYKHTPTQNDIYIGRGSVLGNPFTSIQNRQTKAEFICSTPEQSVENFRNYLSEKIKARDRKVCDELNRIYNLVKTTDVNLICFCKPKICHGDVIKEIIELKIAQKDYERKN